jgi:hypothetical protein
MLEEKKVREECLYCHGQIKTRDPCPYCGDAMLTEPQRSYPSTRPSIMFHHGPLFEPKVAGV